MKITKSQLRQIIKEEINNQLLSEEQLNEGVKEFVDKAMLVAFLATYATVGAGIAGGVMEDQKIEAALAAAEPADLERAKSDLQRYLSCEVPGGGFDDASKWISKSKKAGSGGFGR